MNATENSHINFQVENITPILVVKDMATNKIVVTKL